MPKKYSGEASVKASEKDFADKVLQTAEAVSRKIPMANMKSEGIQVKNEADVSLDRLLAKNNSDGVQKESKKGCDEADDDEQYASG